MSARYVSVVAVTWGNLVTDEISVYGSETAVAKSAYDGVDKDNLTSYTNVLKNKTVLYKGNAVSTLTDERFTEGEVACSDKIMVLTGDMKALYKDICGFTLYFKEIPKNVRLHLSEDNVSFTLVPESTEFYDLAGYSSGKAYFNGQKGRYFRIEMDKPNASTNISLTEVMIYRGQPQLPLIRGGFYQISPNSVGVSANIDKNTAYDWEM